MDGIPRRRRNEPYTWHNISFYLLYLIEAVHDAIEKYATHAGKTPSLSEPVLTISLNRRATGAFVIMIAIASFADLWFQVEYAPQTLAGDAGWAMTVFLFAVLAVVLYGLLINRKFLLFEDFLLVSSRTGSSEIRYRDITDVCRHVEYQKASRNRKGRTSVRLLVRGRKGYVDIGYERTLRGEKLSAWLSEKSKGNVADADFQPLFSSSADGRLLLFSISTAFNHIEFYADGMKVRAGKELVDVPYASISSFWRTLSGTQIFLKAKVEGKQQTIRVPNKMLAPGISLLVWLTYKTENHEEEPEEPSQSALEGEESKNQ